MQLYILDIDPINEIKDIPQWVKDKSAFNLIVHNGIIYCHPEHKPILCSRNIAIALLQPPVYDKVKFKWHEYDLRRIKCN